MMLKIIRQTYFGYHWVACEVRLIVHTHIITADAYVVFVFPHRHAHRLRTAKGPHQVISVFIRFAYTSCSNEIAKPSFKTPLSTPPRV